MTDLKTKPEPFEADVLAIKQGTPCPRCGSIVTTAGTPWDWYFVCPNCGELTDDEVCG